MTGLKQRSMSAGPCGGFATPFRANPVAAIGLTLGAKPRGPNQTAFGLDVSVPFPARMSSCAKVGPLLVTVDSL